MLKHEVPKDPKTLLGTPRQTPIRKILGGDYVHCRGSWRTQHANGLTPFAGSSRQLWPILFCEFRPYSPIFLVGSYCGKPRPADLKSYVDDTMV